MDTTPTTAAHERAITRRELEAVIRRAAELYAADAEAAERISESELLRIASELGLPARHVRQALFELPARSDEPSLLDRICGPATVGALRTIPGDADLAYFRLEDYLTTHEYLAVRRRQPGRTWYAPAEDPVTKVARAFSRPAARFHLARARRTLLAVQPLEPGRAQVRLELDLGDRRKDAALGGGIAGGLVGGGIGSGLAVMAAEAAGELLGPVGGVAAAVLTAGGTVMTGLSVGLAIARARFRRRATAARVEVEGLLDRLERGESLEPPPAPWRRRLRSGLTPRGLPGR